jgi:hypothetical protein
MAQTIPQSQPPNEETHLHRRLVAQELANKNIIITIYKINCSIFSNHVVAILAIDGAATAGDFVGQQLAFGGQRVGPPHVVVGLLLLLLVVDNARQRFAVDRRLAGRALRRVFRRAQFAQQRIEQRLCAFQSQIMIGKL